MQLVNRGYILVQPLQPFIDWAAKIDPELSIGQDHEPSVYLIEEDFFDEEPIIKANYKSIFVTELEAVSEEESDFPEINMANFEAWFTVSLGSTVIDTMSETLDRD